MPNDEPSQPLPRGLALRLCLVLTSASRARTSRASAVPPDTLLPLPLPSPTNEGEFVPASRWVLTLMNVNGSALPVTDSAFWRQV